LKKRRAKKRRLKKKRPLKRMVKRMKKKATANRLPEAKAKAKGQRQDRLSLHHPRIGPLLRIAKRGAKYSRSFET